MNTPTLTIDRIRKRYGDVTALDDLSFDVRPGEIFGFVGSNGAGKTTTMRIVLGYRTVPRGGVRTSTVTEPHALARHARSPSSPGVSSTPRSTSAAS
ncbi:hypothetical protein GCM10023094_50280 [Rhodococcus olei]|uniref:ABC transporter domain-containing protein n=1 Tax=Rhodococcus olei TaxID=2161675 RepID=A0ABP8PPE6_9NOCA